MHTRTNLETENSVSIVSIPFGGLRMRSPHFATVTIGVCGLSVSVASAAFVPLSATRIIWANSPQQVSTAFGLYDRTASGTQFGNNFQATGSVRQNSFIGDGTITQAVSYNGNALWTVTGTGPSNQYLTMVNTFALSFELTTSSVLEHTFPTTTGFACRLTPAGGTEINLLAAGANNIPLAAGMYMLNINGSHTIFASTISGSAVLNGTISFVPAPSASAAVLASALLAVRRKR